MGCMDPVSREKIKSFSISHSCFWSYHATRMTFASFGSRILRNFVTNPESRRQKSSNPAYRETPSGPFRYQKSFVRGIIFVHTLLAH